MPVGWVPCIKDDAVKRYGLKADGTVVAHLPAGGQPYEIPLFFHEVRADDYGSSLQRDRYARCATCT